MGMSPYCLSGISVGFPTLSQSSGQIVYVLLTRSPLDCPASWALSFDLHVLGTPPAFILSQDQTLRLIITLFVFRFYSCLNDTLRYWRVLSVCFSKNDSPSATVLIYNTTSKTTVNNFFNFFLYLFSMFFQHYHIFCLVDKMGAFTLLFIVRNAGKSLNFRPFKRDFIFLFYRLEVIFQFKTILTASGCCTNMRRDSQISLNTVRSL